MMFTLFQANWQLGSQYSSLRGPSCWRGSLRKHWKSLTVLQGIQSACARFKGFSCEGANAHMACTQLLTAVLNFAQVLRSH
mmetsp:Transcript_54367/g.129555  ORF Transcript_54367/g.129555 Transcript_54367/m.129555 type:complete len:81 (-) Transcript_54367:12-254(-)